MQQIADWLENLGMSEYVQCFVENRIDFSVLPDLTDQHLKDLGLPLGDRLKILRAIRELSKTGSEPPQPEPRSQDTAERRQVTVMFSDLVGSTALSARMDPEDPREVISAYQKCVAETVIRFGGFVAKYMGDGVLIYFGYPQAHEDDEMVERAIAAFGQVQFLFNSAGAAIRRAKFLEIDDTLMEKTFALNVNGTLYGMQALLPQMLANRHGVIVNMASMAHRRGGPGSSIHYAAAKGAVVSMTLGVAREFATQGIRALSISPGPIKTPFQSAAQSSPELIKQFLDDMPMQRFGKPEEIGELVLFICSDACEFMTADTVYVNGGGGWR